jgi:hypothetical protein
LNRKNGFYEIKENDSVEGDFRRFVQRISEDLFRGFQKICSEDFGRFVQKISEDLFRRFRKICSDNKVKNLQNICFWVY